MPLGILAHSNYFCHGILVIYKNLPASHVTKNSKYPCAEIRAGSGLETFGLSCEDY